MYDIINNVNTALNNFIWGVPAMVCILGVGLYLTVGSGFIQIRKFGYAMKQTLGKVFGKHDSAAGSHTFTPLFSAKKRRKIFFHVMPRFDALFPFVIPRFSSFPSSLVLTQSKRQGISSFFLSPVIPPFLQSKNGQGIFDSPQKKLLHCCKSLKW